MAVVNIFGSAALDGGAGYGTDIDLTAITVGTNFFVWQESDTTAVGVRIYIDASVTTDLSGAWAYLLDGSQPAVLQAAKQQALIAGKWNEVTFDTPIALGSSVHYIAAFYLPSGGYSFKAHVFDNQLVSPQDPALTAAIGSSGAGNGVFFSGSQATPSTPSISAWSASNNTHYGVDVLVDDPAITLPTDVEDVLSDEVDILHSSDDVLRSHTDILENL